MQKPCTSATVGKGSAATWSKTSLPRRVKANASSGSFSRVNSSMSAPAAKPFSLADRMARPVGGMERRWAATCPSSRNASLEKVLVVLPARSNASQASPSASSVSFQWRMSIVLLSSDVQRLLDVGDRDARLVHDFHAEARLVLAAVLGARARFGHVLLRQREA